MASGAAFMAYSALSSMAVGAATRAVTGQGTSFGNLGMDALGGAFGGMGGMASLGTSTMGNTLSSGIMTGAMSGVTGNVQGGGTGGAQSGNVAGSGVNLGNVSTPNYLGMMGQFGQSVLNNSSDIGDAQYNSQMTELQNYQSIQQGVYSRSANYKEAEIINRQAEIRLAAMRRELFRRNHSLGAHRGVQMNSGSVVDVREDLIKQANYDMEIVKFQAEIDSSRYVGKGDMAVWNSESSSMLNSSVAEKQLSDTTSDTTLSMVNSGVEMAGSLLR